MHYLSRLKDSKVSSFGQLLGLTGFAQILIQGIAFLSGFMIIRLLPTQEYALYTLANTMLSTMSLLADGGISTGVMAQSSKVWQDRRKLGSVLVTGLELRSKFATVSLLVSLPILLYLLLHNGASVLTAILITICLIPAFFAALSDSLLEIVPKLHQAIVPLQKNQVNVSVIRLLLSTISLFFFPWAYIAIFMAGLPRIWGNFQLRKIVHTYADMRRNPDLIIRKEILAIVKRSLPAVIYFCLSGQVNIWIMSVFGKSTSLAQIGALGRLTMLLSFFLPIVNMLVAPRFARTPNNSPKLLSIYIKSITIVLLICCMVVTFTWFYSDYLLWVIGDFYLGLKIELTLLMIASSLSLTMSVAFSLYVSKGWILQSFLSIAISVCPLILGSLIFDVSSLRGVLYLNIFTSFIQMLLHIIFGFYKIIQTKNIN